MSEPFTADANGGIIGLSPKPNDDDWWWPTAGYDNHIGFAWTGQEVVFARSNHPREEWLALADEMIRRWAEWKAYIAGLPDGADT